jgi:hypothetical protein
MESLNENSKNGKKVKIKKVIKESYALLKVVGGNKKNTEKNDTRVKTNLKAYFEAKLSGTSTKHNKQKITIKENMQKINNSCLEEQQPTINLLPIFNKVNFVAAVGQKKIFLTILSLFCIISIKQTMNIIK